MKEYVCGFMFNAAKDEVPLIEKKRPAWQQGLLNGIGGKLESTEYTIEGMVREFREETGVITSIDDWAQVLVLIFKKAVIHFYAASDQAAFQAASSTTDEIIYRRAFDDLDGTVDNIPALITLSLQRLRDRDGNGEIQEATS